MKVSKIFAEAHDFNFGRHKKAIETYKETMRLKPYNAEAKAQFNLVSNLGSYYENAFRLKSYLPNKNHTF